MQARIANRNRTYNTFVVQNVLLGHVFYRLAQISTYQVTDWSKGLRTSAIPHDIFDTIFMTSLRDTNQRKMDVTTSENFDETRNCKLLAQLTNQGPEIRQLSAL